MAFQRLYTSNPSEKRLKEIIAKEQKKKKELVEKLKTANANLRGAKSALAQKKK